MLDKKCVHQISIFIFLSPVKDRTGGLKRFKTKEQLKKSPDLFFFRGDQQSITCHVHVKLQSKDIFKISTMRNYLQITVFKKEKKKKKRKVLTEHYRIILICYTCTNNIQILENIPQSVSMPMNIFFIFSFCSRSIFQGF